MKLNQRQSCPLCGKNQSSIYIDFNDIPVVKCKNCTFIYSGFTMSSEDLNVYYSNDFGGNRHEEGQLVNAFVNEVIIQRMIDFDKGMNILDVGTGYGFFIDGLKKKFGIDSVVGVELSRQEAEYGREQLGLTMYSTTLMETGLPHKSFDLVCAFEVIEHTIDPISFLKELEIFLSPKGKLIIVTDNFESKVVKSLGAGWPKWIPHIHISHFSPKSIEFALKQTGFKIEKGYSITPWEHLFRSWFYKITCRKISPKDGYNLEETLNTEMTGEYKLFGIRKFFNPIWSRLFVRQDLKGAMMYIVASRI